MRIDASTNEIVGFDNIVIDGEQWDATFNDVWSGKFYKQSFAEKATDAVLAEFTSGGAFFNTSIDISHDTRVVGFEGPQPDQNAFNTAYGYWQHNDDLFWSASLSNRFDDAIAGIGDKRGTWLAKVDGSEHQYLTYVDWEKQVSAVPVPAAAFMFAPAALGFLGSRRRTKQA